MEFTLSSNFPVPSSRQVPSPQHLFLKRKLCPVDETVSENPFLQTSFISEQMARKIQQIQISPPRKRARLNSPPFSHTDDSSSSKRKRASKSTPSSSPPSSSSFFPSSHSADTFGVTPKKRKTTPSPNSSDPPSPTYDITSTSCFQMIDMLRISDDPKEEKIINMGGEEEMEMNVCIEMGNEKGGVHKITTDKKGAWKLGVSFPLPTYDEFLASRTQKMEEDDQDTRTGMEM